MALEIISIWRNAIDNRLDTLLPDANLLSGAAKSIAPLTDAMRYACLAPGKRIRPTLCLLSAESVGGEALALLDVACAVEMVHCFSLIHDDLPAIDNDDLRRGRKTVHKQFSEATAIMAGDALLALAFEVISKAKGSPERIIESLRRLTEAIGTDGLVGGEMLDILSEKKPPDKDLLEFIHLRKTAALFAASCAIGGCLAGGEVDKVQILYEYGELLGLAFQISDDLLNETATAEQLGKGAGTDRERQKMTYPAIYGEQFARQTALDVVRRAQALANQLPFRSHELSSLALFAVERLH